MASLYLSHVAFWLDEFSSAEYAARTVEVGAFAGHGWVSGLVGGEGCGAFGLGVEEMRMEEKSFNRYIVPGNLMPAGEGKILSDTVPRDCRLSIGSLR